MYKKVIIIPYFGQWPFWFNYFLESCRPNTEYDWIFYTDCGIPEKHPNNTKFIEISFDDYKKRVSLSLGINFNPESAYKLCDLKPALGYIHADEIQHYDFFGFGDIDIICGNLNTFFTDRKLNEYDIISAHYRRLSGHFCLLRNTDEMRKMFFRVEGWRDELESQIHTAFDEKSFSDLFVRHKSLPPKLRRIICQFYRLPKRASFEEAYSTPDTKPVWHDGSRNYPKVWFYENGKLTNDQDDSREFPYLHFLYWKKDVWKINISNELLEYPSSRWSIDSSGFS